MWSISLHIEKFLKWRGHDNKSVQNFVTHTVTQFVLNFLDNKIQITNRVRFPIYM